jgi:hypothetical protein
MRSTRLLCFLGLAALLVMPRSLVAQGHLSLDFETTFIAFPMPGFADFDVGWVDHPVVVSVRSRPPHSTWELRIRATDPDMGGYGKPVSDILWRSDASGGWVPLTGLDQFVMRSTGDQQLTLHFRAKIDWDLDVPGTYATGLAFTLLRP